MSNQNYDYASMNNISANNIRQENFALNMSNAKLLLIVYFIHEQLILDEKVMTDTS